MNITLSENIRRYRKERRLTQEQLAEVFGITVGAVSKWESGASVPDITLIVEMADFFDVSVDALLGYQKQDNNLSRILEDIRTLRNARRFDEAGVTAEKALVKYPNNFEVCHKSAIMYVTMGVERKEEKAYARALELFQRSLELISQNTNEKINMWTIRNDIARTYLCLERTDDALTEMKKNNAGGLNDGIIGYTLASVTDRPDEALPYLTDALIEKLSALLNICIGYSNAYRMKKQPQEATAVLRWMLSILEGLKKPGETSYHDRERVQLLCGCAFIAAQSGDREAAVSYLRQAREAAREFDAAPDYEFTKMRFFHGETGKTAFDDFGATAMEGISAFVLQDEENKAALEPLWRMLQEEM